MISKGSLNGSPIGEYPVNGGGFIGEVSGDILVGTSHKTRATVRRFAGASTAIAMFGRMVTGITSMTMVAVHVSGAIKVRKITAGKASVMAHLAGTALRRPVLNGISSVAVSHLGKAGYLYFRPTDRRRISSIMESRSTAIAADHRVSTIHRDPRLTVVPREAE